jgi:type 1 glutamine amidotransferase
MTRVLYLYGGWPGHRPHEVAVWAREQFAALGFDVDETQDPLRLEEDLTGYDLIVVGWTSQVQTTEDLTPTQEQRLLEAVRSGTGVAGWHGMASSFRGSLPYQLVVGGGFLAHPGDLGVTYDVRIADPGHEVTRGVGDFTVTTEQYYLHTDPSNHVLATTTFGGEHVPWLDGVRMPVAWVRTWGRGRVFYCTIGHAPQDLRAAAVTQLVRQGMAWAARQPVAPDSGRAFVGGSL